jgi:hypothetical protein
LTPNPVLLSLSIACSHSARGFQLTTVWDAKLRVSAFLRRCFYRVVNDVAVSCEYDVTCHMIPALPR